MQCHHEKNNTLTMEYSVGIELTMRMIPSFGRHAIPYYRIVYQKSICKLVKPRLKPSGSFSGPLRAFRKAPGSPGVHGRPQNSLVYQKSICKLILYRLGLSGGLSGPLRAFGEALGKPRGTREAPEWFSLSKIYMQTRTISIGTLGKPFWAALGPSGNPRKAPGYTGSPKMV